MTDLSRLVSRGLWDELDDELRRYDDQAGVTAMNSVDEEALDRLTHGDPVEWGRQVIAQRRAELAQELNDSLEPSRESLEAQLKMLLDIREAINLFDKQKKPIEDLIKFYLERHPEEKLRDGEHGVTAWLQERADGKARPIDLWALYEGNRPLFEQLIKTNSLQIHEAGLKAAGALVGGIERYLGPRGVTRALLVKSDK